MGYIMGALKIMIGIALLGLLATCAASNNANFKAKFYEQGYIAACKDFYDGTLKYDLKELPGGEKQWVRKENGR